MKSHEASLGKLQRCLRLPRELKLQWREGEQSFPSTLGQHSSFPQITQSKLELSEHIFILVTQPRHSLGLTPGGIHGCAVPELKGLPRRPCQAASQAGVHGLWWEDVPCQQTCSRRMVLSTGTGSSQRPWLRDCRG